MPLSSTFEMYLRKGRPLQRSNKMGNNGVMKHIERLKKMMNLALDLEWVEKNPLARYKLKFKKHDKEFLNLEELESIENVNLSEKGLSIVRDIFIFSCYTGLSYADVRLLREDNITRGIDGDHWIFTQRKKNEQRVKIPLLEKAHDILRKYGDFPNGNHGRLLPVYSNQKVNVYLKEICKEAGVGKNVTFHSARHTFATTVTLSNGVPIETVSKLLGHTKLSTTQIYARVLQKKVGEDMKNLMEVLESKERNMAKTEAGDIRLSK